MCDETVASSDAICECGEEQETPDSEATTDACDESSWPDVDNGLVCDDCKVLVDKFDTVYKTCNGYCQAVGRQCVGAWEENDETCDAKHTMTCDETVASSDAICECGEEQETPDSENTTAVPTAAPMVAPTAALTAVPA